jgi:hypothetical protein
VQHGLAALFSSAAVTTIGRLGADLFRAKGVIHTTVPKFHGDQTNTIKVGRWMKFFEAEVGDAGLPGANWAKAVVGHFPGDSAAAVWDASVFGERTDFTTSWKAVRAAFLRQYTLAKAVPMAQTALKQLSMTTFGNDRLSFNYDINLTVLYYDNMFPNSRLPGLTKPGLVTSYSIKLCEPVK